MRFSVYVTVEGPAIDPEAFNSSLPLELRGEAKERHNSKHRPGGPQRFYWRSRQIECEQRPEDELVELLTALQASLEGISSDRSAKISTQIVGWQAENDDARGYYVPSELVQLLAYLHADLDIDVVHDLQGKPGVE